MKINEILKTGKSTLSFEFFPPKTDEQESNLFKVIEALKKYNPSFISITYGAMGKNKERTFEWAKRIKNEFGIEPVAHFTCIGMQKEEIKKQINQLAEMGVENVLALRGDFPEGENKTIGSFSHADELVSFIKSCQPNLCIGVAGYPEKHPEAKSLENDIDNLKRKIDAGADYIVTQLFFNNKDYLNFIDKCKKQGIKVPIIPGIMPITSYKSIRKMAKVSGAWIPDELFNQIDEHREDVDQVRKIGIDYSIKQCQELLNQKVVGLHFFVLNQSGPISAILSKLI